MIPGALARNVPHAATVCAGDQAQLRAISAAVKNPF